MLRRTCCFIGVCAHTFLWVDLGAQMTGLLEMLGGQRPSPNEKIFFLTSLVVKANTWKSPVTTFGAEKMATAQSWFRQQTLKCGLALSLGIVLGCYVPLEALVRFQKLAKSGTDLLAATAEGSYWSLPSSQEVTGKRKESKTSNQIPTHLINLTWKFCLKAVKE